MLALVLKTDADRLNIHKISILIVTAVIVSAKDLCSFRIFVDNRHWNQCDSRR